MDKEKLKEHCEKQVKMCERLGDTKHLLEHQLVLDILEENEKLANKCEKAARLLKEFYDSGTTPLKNISEAYEVLQGE